MSDKLQELTDKLYNEGLSKGRQEGERIIAEAQSQAEAIIAAAKAEAEAVRSKAASEAEDLKGKVSSDLKMASEQCLQATKKDIENILLNGIVADKVSAATQDRDFIREIISAIAEKFSASEPAEMALVLPEKMKDELEPWVAGELSKAVGAGIRATFSKKVAGGFTIGPGDGSWYVSLTDETFKSLIAEYLRPVTRKLLFG